MMERARHLGALALAAIVLAACNTKGENIPLTIAKYHPPKPLVGETVRLTPEPALPDRTVRIADHAWVPTATDYVLPARLVRPVGSSAGFTLFALAWDSPPFDRLLLRQGAPLWLRDAGAYPTRPDYWREFLRVY